MMTVMESGGEQGLLLKERTSERRGGKNTSPKLSPLVCLALALLSRAALGTEAHLQNISESHSPSAVGSAGTQLQGQAKCLRALRGHKRRV